MSWQGTNSDRVVLGGALGHMKHMEAGTTCPSLAGHDGLLGALALSSHSRVSQPRCRAPGARTAASIWLRPELVDNQRDSSTARVFDVVMAEGQPLHCLATSSVALLEFQRLQGILGHVILGA